MQFQAKKGWCGPASIHNALACYDYMAPQPGLAKTAGTTVKNGTDEKGIVAALRHHGFEGLVFNEPDDTRAVTWLQSVLLAGCAAILLTEGGDHWELAFGILGENVLVFDPQRTVANRAANGLWVLAPEELAQYWAPFQGRHFAIGVVRP